MNSIKEAQKALEEYDRMHWSHKAGVETLEHTFFHLVVSVCSALKRHKAAWADRFREEMPGLLIEHALRLANDANNDLGKNIMRYASVYYIVDVDHWIQEGWDSFSTKSVDSHLRDLMVSLGPLVEVCEEAGHGKPVDYLKVMQTARRLMYFAAVFETGIVRQNIVPTFLVPFERRLEELKVRFEYTTSA